ncbi:Uncharacterised protein [Nocardia otitidiscaviarum]|uniref:Uncharacterized protein n=2 Tax=Nocardia otitidiscaviarum TaxID=1823 RepID=A0A378YIR4_9NOCA|nr:Uncharacterised protein [Nocardia otitidiscaviarum]
MFEQCPGRPIIDEAAAAAGRNPADIATIYNVAGTISRDPRPATRDPLPRTRSAEGRWIGGSVTQWVEELTYAVTEHRAGAFVYLTRPGDIISDDTVDRWAFEVVPAVREAIAQH